MRWHWGLWKPTGSRLYPQRLAGDLWNRWLEDALEAVKAGEMQGSIYNDRVDQAKKMAKMAVTLFEGKGLDQEGLKDGRYYFSEYKKVDGSNIEEYLNAEEEEADGKSMEP